jgi:pSer/pThr/pTyr-binding forkhead associated (FHA) protein
MLKISTQGDLFMQHSDTQPLDSFDALALGLPTKLRFVIDNGGGLIEVAGYELVTVGRQLDKVGTVVDLAAFDGARLGVSRRHVEIFPHNGHLIVQDLQSVNGSWLNGEKLDPDRPYPIKHGDQLRLGQMQIELWFLGGDYED